MHVVAAHAKKDACESRKSMALNWDVIRLEPGCRDGSAPAIIIFSEIRVTVKWVCETLVVSLDPCWTKSYSPVSKLHSCMHAGYGAADRAMMHKYLARG